MKKMKLPGGNISLKTKKSEDPLVMAWLNAQSNLMDSFRYLVEKEIMQNGVRNLQTYIPTERTNLQSSPGVQEAGDYQASRQQLAAAAETEDGHVKAETIAVAGEADDKHAAASSPEPEAEEIDEEEVDEEDIDAWS